MEIESVKLNLIFKKAMCIYSEDKVLTNQILLLLVRCHTVGSNSKNHLPTKPLVSSPSSPPPLCLLIK